MQFAVLAAVSLAGAASHRSGFEVAALLCVPTSLLDMTLGLGLFRRLSDMRFNQVVYEMLISSGVSYLA